MTIAVDPTVLRRKIAAHRRAPAARPDTGQMLGRALTRALRRAATPFEGLGLLPGAVSVAPGQALDDAVAALPDHGLVAALEDGEVRGLIALGPGLVDALVEVQTTGRVEAVALPPRPVTRIDEALVRDFIDLTLAGLSREGAAIDGRDWPDRMGYGSRIRDRGQVNLLLPEADYIVLSVDLGFERVDRRAPLVLVLPSDPARVQPVAPAQKAAADPAWIAARARMVDALRLPLEVVLMRLTRPLSEVEGLAVGDLLPFGPADLNEVALETAGGRALVHGRLGQVGGRRALRLPPRIAAATPAQSVPEPRPAAPPALAPDPAAPPPAGSATAPLDPAGLVAR